MQVTETNVYEARDLARAKLIQVFRYLQALHQLRNPIPREIAAQPWVLWLHDLPDHPCIRLGALTVMGSPMDGEDTGGSAGADRDGTRTTDDFIVKVSRPRLTNPPEPPPEIVPWLQSGWQQVDGSVTVQPFILEGESSPDAEEEARAIPFDADPRRQNLLEGWTARREDWAEAERPARRAMAIFEKLYALYAQLGRESERLELMLGDGLLTWRHDSGAEVHHPILLLRLHLRFNPDIPEFTISEAEYPPELYTALFRSLPDIPAAAIAACRDDLEHGGWHPLGGDETNSFLRRLVTQLSPYGRLADESIPEGVQHIPVITRDPVLFVRHRTLGFGTALEAILEDLPGREHLPFSLTSVVGIDAEAQPAAESAADAAALASPNGEDEQVFLSKPANPEQVEIARRLEQHGAVLVQGPPGTGKTHTIANLLGHLLAQGKSVLVTSHTAKALKVLREQVVEPLQPLCVSVLDDDGQQMESAVDEITERLASSDAEALEREAAVLLRRRAELVQALRETRERLKEARYDEYRPIMLAAEEYTPSQAARHLAEMRETAGWIAGPVAPDGPLPLTQSELVELYRSNALVSAEDEAELALALPEPAQLVSPGDFERLVARREELPGDQLEERGDLWKATPEPQAPEPLEAIYQQLLKALEPLRDVTRWRLAAMTAGREGGPARQAWDDLLADVEDVYALATRAQPLLWKHDPLVPPECLPDRIEQVLDDMCDALQDGGKLSSFQLLRHRDWKTVIEQARVKHRPPELPEHFEALRALVRLRSARASLVDRWQRQVTALDGPDADALGAEPEKACHQYVPLLCQCLNWFPETWRPLAQALDQQGFAWDMFMLEVPVNLAEYGDLLRLREAALERLPDIITAEIERRRRAHDEAQWLALRQQAELFGGSAARARVVQQLQAAVEQLDVQAYQQAFERLADLAVRREVLHRRQALLAQLEQAAPAWASAIRHRAGVHGEAELPGNPHDAWRWRQLDDELERRASVSLDALQTQIATLSSDLQRTTALLVEKKAWAARVRRTTPEQQRALQGWKQLMQRAGKGKGKRAPRLLAEARRLMPICQSAVPVWIMPLSRVVDNFDPKRNRFDVVIIDEASQADLMALAAVYMSQQVMVVGDHEQVSPVAVGQRLDEVQRLIDEHLAGIPNAMLYDGQFSIYDLAQTTFKPVCLREHFRCVSPIIEFSNRLSYEGKIRPLRDASEVRRRPHLVHYHVAGAMASDRVNEDEALAVASLVVAAAEQPEYAGASFGVISMVGEEQALRIDTLLQRHLPPAEYNRRRVQCGNAAHFQGDERDVVFLSMVDTATGAGPLPVRLEGPGNIFKKRYNVAASRARDQLWVVHSLDPEVDLKPHDIRRRLIQHSRAPAGEDRLTDAEEQQPLSELEQQVMHLLTERGYRVTPRWPVGAYQIDLVVEGGGKRLAIACDGDRWCAREDLEEDMARQAILERLGWRFARIRGSQFFRDPEQTTAGIVARLRKLGIAPEGANDGVTDAREEAQALQTRIILRAAALREEWAAQEAEMPAQPVRPAASWGRPWPRKESVEEPEPLPMILPNRSGDAAQWAILAQAEPAPAVLPVPQRSPASAIPEAAPVARIQPAQHTPMFFPGDQVKHETYGIGRVVKVEFDSKVGHKTMEAKLTRLEKLSQGTGI
jgi:very-short-patch-repair endonuclease